MWFSSAVGGRAGEGCTVFLGWKSELRLHYSALAHLDQ